MASDKHRDFLDERAQTLLRILVDKYIREGQPVGSRTLSRDSGLDLSPATIRNIVADLEELGFVSSPHTSAGRIPTNKGYRFFVDTLIKLTPPKGEDLLRFSQGLNEAAGDPQALAISVSNLLSAVTHLAGIVTVPRRAQTSLRQMEFLPLSGKRVLAILVVNDREVQNKIVDVQRDFTADELRQATNYLNDPNAYLSGPGQATLDAVLRKLSATHGNPIDSPTALGIATQAGLADWRDAVTGFGNLGLAGEDTRANLMAGAARADSGIYDALGYGLQQATQPRRGLGDFLKGLI